MGINNKNNKKIFEQTKYRENVKKYILIIYKYYLYSILLRVYNKSDFMRFYKFSKFL